MRFLYPLFSCEYLRHYFLKKSPHMLCIWGTFNSFVPPHKKFVLVLDIYLKILFSNIVPLTAQAFFWVDVILYANPFVKQIWTLISKQFKEFLRISIFLNLFCNPFMESRTPPFLSLVPNCSYGIGV